MKKRLDRKLILASSGILMLAVGCFLFWASADVGSGVYMTCLCEGPDNRHAVSITFDDGPDEVMTPRILDILKEHDIKATFFLIGSKAEKNPELVSRIVEEGHIVGGHSWTHACDFPVQSSDSIYVELSRCEDVICDITGRRISIFRPPFGVTNPLIAEAVEKKGYVNIGWSVRSLDTKERWDREFVMKRIAGLLHDGAVILLHDRCDRADVLLKMLIADLEAKEYEIINIDEMLDIEPYRL